jgi:hypothetical protein
MRLQDGTPRQKVLFALLVAVFVAGLALSLADEVRRVGTPNVGWMLDTGYVSPTRRDASHAGLRFGGRAVTINGVPVEPDPSVRDAGRAARTDIGASNTLVFETPAGSTREISVAVRPWDWHDILFTKGAVDTIGVLFFVVAVISFAIRPYQPGSWALLILATVSAGALLTTYTSIGDRSKPITTIYFFTMISAVMYAPLHAALAFPVTHPILSRRPRLPWLIYGVGIVHALFYIAAWWTGFTGVFAYFRSSRAAVSSRCRAAIRWWRSARASCSPAAPWVSVRSWSRSSCSRRLGSCRSTTVSRCGRSPCSCSRSPASPCAKS